MTTSTQPHTSHGRSLLYSALLATGAAVAQPAAIMSLEPEAEPASTATVKGEASYANAPANFRSFPSAQLGEATAPKELKLHFGAATRLKTIDISPDFLIGQGSNCIEGRSYVAGQSCVLRVSFTPQGAGPRLGKLIITQSASAQPLSLGLGGYGYAPVVSFTPAVITTVPGTYPSKTGLLNGAHNLAVDGGDTLYVADTGNGLIRSMDSSGNIVTFASGYTGLWGVAVDNFGEIYFDLPSTGKMYEIYDYGPVVQASGVGTASCPVGAPCTLNSEALGTPGTMSMDPYNHLFFADSHQGAAISTVQPIPANLIFLYDPFTYQQSPSSPLVADYNDNVYTLWGSGGTCSIIMQTLYDMEYSNVTFVKVAGGHTCGFSGDGGQARNAEIGALIGQMAFDLAGNFYFSDTNNQRVRRIDAATGIIKTIAGNGTAGYNGDNGPATAAKLNNPTGVAVDSQGQVYIISGAITSPQQVIRKVGPDGKLSFGSVAHGTTSAAKIVTVSNTGNATLTLTNEVINGTNAADYSVDPNTTSCSLVAGATLAAGQSCKIGILFKPSAVGTRSANLVLLDNSVNNSDTVNLTGVGT